MNRAPDQLEETLYQAYQVISERYQQAIDAARSLTQATQPGPGWDDHLLRLTNLLDQVAAVERQVAEPKRAWQAEGRKPSPQFAALLDRIAARIRELIELNQKAEQVAGQQRDQLIPALETAALGQRMRQAYQAAMTTRP